MNSTIEILIDAYLSDSHLLGSPAEEDAVAIIAAKLDDAISANPKRDLTELAADYELAARRAGFVAGFRAALSICIAR